MIKLIQKIFIATGLVISLLFVGQMISPTSTLAADSCTDLKNKIENGGFTVTGNLPEYCSTGAVYNKFINLALYGIAIAAVIAIIYGGYLYMTAAGKEDQAKKGRAVLTWAVLGLAVVVLAAVLINVVVSAIVENRFV